MTPAFRFDDKVAIITGAGSGLGRSYALLLAARGAKVVANDAAQSVQGVVEEIRKSGGAAVASVRKVGSREAGEAIVEDAIAAFGKVDILVNNAGITRDKAFHKMGPEDLEQVIDVHLLGSFFTSQAAFRLMREQGGGRIVNTASAAGFYGNFGQANYSAAKMGLVGLTRTIAMEGAKSNIAANLICPGARTAMTEALMPETAVLPPEWVAAAVAWLCHPECSWTGEIIIASGGRFARMFIAETRGIYIDEPTIEDVASNIDRIASTDRFAIFADLQGASKLRSEMKREAGDVDSADR